MSMQPQTMLIPLSHLTLSDTPMQIERRKERTQEEISDLADTIVRIGQLQPIIVRPNPFPENIRATDGGPLYEIVAGEGRYLAAKLAGLETIEAKVRELTDEQAEEVQLIENLQRKDLNEMLEAVGFEQLMKRGHTADEIAERVGKSRRTIYARLQLLKLGDKARAAVREGKLDVSIALLIARLDEKLQEDALQDLIEPGYDGRPMSYRQAREFVHREYTFQLDQAGFDPNDTTLVPSAGACSGCPKRSGNQPELFSDIERADVCTDPVCFKSKREAHVQLQLKKAKAAGQKIISGSEAKRLVAWESAQGVDLMSSHVRLEDKSYEDGKYRTFGELVKAAGLQVKPKLLQTPGGKIIEVLEREPLVEQLRDAGALEKHKSYSPPKPQKLDPGRERSKKVNARLFQAIFNKAPVVPRSVAVQEFLKDVFELGGFNFDAVEVCGALGWDDFNLDNPLKELKKLDESDLYRLLYVLQFADDLSEWGQPERMYQAAKRLKIDVKKIETEIDAAAAKKNPTKKAPAKKKASKRK